MVFEPLYLSRQRFIGARIMKSTFTSLCDLASLRDLSTLRDLCYFVLPKEQHALLKELCLPVPDWDYYNIVNRDFPISRDYFMLPLTQGRDCCQVSRFVEVYTKFKLIPDSKIMLLCNII